MARNWRLACIQGLPKSYWFWHRFEANPSGFLLQPSKIKQFAVQNQLKSRNP